jgi:hypothetical protein
MSEFLKNKRVCVTGGAGFLGTRLVERLERAQCREIFIPLVEDYDLVDIEAVRRMYDDAEPDVVIHLAAVVGGIGANREHPGSFFYKNLMMGVQLIHEADDLRLPEVHARPLPRGRPLGRLPRGDERPLRPREEDAPRPGAVLPRRVRIERDLPPAREPLRAGRQLRP